VCILLSILILDAISHELLINYLYLHRYLRDLECFKSADRKKYIVWTDTGAHFRNSEFMHYLFKELFNQKVSVSFNLICEKHGKNSRDQHFSVFSSFIFRESMVKKLTSSQDICDAIIKQQAIANMNNLRINELRKIDSTRKAQKSVVTKAFVIPFNPRAINTNPRLIVIGLKKYYNFFSSNSFLYTHFMSDQLNFVRLYASISKSFTEIKTTVKSDKILPQIINNNYLNVKMSNWKMLQRIRGNRLMSSEIASDNLNDNRYAHRENHCKTKCSDCREICQYRLGEINQITNNKSLLTQSQVIQELNRHGHPKSRMNAQRKNRTFAEAKAELRFHYMENHYNTLP